MQWRVTFSLLLLRDSCSIFVDIFGSIERRIGLLLMILCVLLLEQLLEFSHPLGITTLTEVLEGGTFLFGIFSISG